MLQRLFYAFILFLARIACHALLRLRILGCGFVPKKGPLIVAATHSSFVDPAVAAVAVTRPVTFMAKAFLFEPFFFGWLIRNLGAFPLKTDSEVGAVKLSLKLLRENRALMIFPEGTRIRRDGLGRPHPGVGLIASRTGAPVLPIYIQGSHDALTDVFKGKPPRVRAYIAPPIIIEPPPGECDKQAWYEAASGRVMREIARMRNWCLREQGLPPEPYGTFVTDDKPDRPPPGEKWSIS
ncbi:MAG: lysophospholipid acyltransferase family protein [bacterium]|nr:lysophospholipid acyltransferase family protein [bacterium]